MKLPFLFLYLLIQITIIHTFNQYLGCFIDRIGDRDLNIFVGDYEQITPTQCILACEKQNYLYAGIQYGNECRCGQQYGRYGQVSDDECYYLCSTSERCGGDYRNSVYKVVQFIDQSNTELSQLSEKQVRVKRANAATDSMQTIDVSSMVTSITSPSLITITFDNINSDQLISSTINDISTIEHSSTVISDVPSSTAISITIHDFSTSTNTISVSQLFTNSTSSIDIDTSETSSFMDTIFSFTSTETNIPTSSKSFSTIISSSNSIVYNDLTSDTPTSFSTIITTESYSDSSIITLSPDQETSSIPQQDINDSTSTSTTTTTSSSTSTTTTTTSSSTSTTRTSTLTATTFTSTTTSSSTSTATTFTGTTTSSSTLTTTIFISTTTSSSTTTTFTGTTTSSLTTTTFTGTTTSSSTTATFTGTTTPSSTTTTFTGTTTPSSTTTTFTGTTTSSPTTKTATSVTISSSTTVTFTSTTTTFTSTTTSSSTSTTTTTFTGTTTSPPTTTTVTSVTTSSSTTVTFTSTTASVSSTTTSSSTSTTTTTFTGTTTSSSTTTTFTGTTTSPPTTTTVTSVTTSSSTTVTFASTTASISSTTTSSSSSITVTSTSATTTFTSTTTSASTTVTFASTTASISSTTTSSSSSITVTSTSATTTFTSTTTSSSTSTATMTTTSTTSSSTSTAVTSTSTTTMTTTSTTSSSTSTAVTSTSTTTMTTTSTTSSSTSTAVTSTSTTTMTTTSTTSSSTSTAVTSTSTTTTITGATTSSSASSSTSTMVATSTTSSATSITTATITGTNTSTSTTSSTTVTTTSSSTSYVNQTTVSTSSVQTIATSTPQASYVVYTVIIVNVNDNFTPASNATRETIRTRLSAIMNLGFLCLANPSSSNCTANQRRKRQCLGYNVILISNITEIASTATSLQYLITYYVIDSCNQNSLVSAIQVETAVNTLSSDQIRQILLYDYEGDLVRTTATNTTDTPSTDRKLWIIGAVLGPVAFVLLLVFTFCYLHYKCRPRPTNRTLAKTIANAPQASARTTNYQTIGNQPVKETPVVEKNLQVLTQNDPLVGASPSPRRVTPIETEKAPTYAVTTELSMDEIRRQNDVERWRNKLRLQEKFQQSTIPNVSQYDNRAYESDPLQFNLQPVTEILSDHSPRPKPRTTEVQVGRTKLHRLLDEVLDQADQDEVYNPDSETERQKRRRQRRRLHSTSNETNTLPLNSQTPHIPVVPQVLERPDSNLVQLRYNPYEAGDRVHDISRLKPVELRHKYPYDDQRSNPYSSRSNPPLFSDDINLPDRAATATNAYANPKRLGKTRLETDREATMRHDGGQVHRRAHQFHDDAVYLDTIPRNRNDYHVQARTVWVEPETDNDSFMKNDYVTAKRSIANTKNYISSIHENLQRISLPEMDEYHA